MKYGLIGEKLGHSFSKTIHERLSDYQYDLYPLDETAFHQFMKAKDFRAINVTIPYKMAVLPYLSHIDAKAKKIGAVNTILNQNGVLYGTNTDYDGFLYTLRKHQIHVKGKKVLVIGDGGAAQAIKAVCHDEMCASLLSTRRTLSATTISYEEAKQKHRDVQIIINTSPCGMYPHNEDCPCDLRDFPDCEAVVDIIYNPLATKLCLQAKQSGIVYAGGLEMLIAQAKYAVEFFTQTTLDDACIETIHQELLHEKRNLVLIGMPSCGKTTIGKMLATKLHKTFLDLDEAIVTESGRSIKAIIHEDGEDAFRRLEHEACRKYAKTQGLIIATGGGVIKNPENMELLAMNGIIFYIKRNLGSLLVDEERPLSSSKAAIAQMLKDREPLYEAYSDMTIENNTTLAKAVDQIIEAYQK